MTSSDLWTEDQAKRYDADGAAMFAPDVLGPTLDALERLADGGAALELAIGTGRVGVALHQRGVPVSGIERGALHSGGGAVGVRHGQLGRAGGDVAPPAARGGRTVDGSAAGLERESRWEDWNENVFTVESEKHVSVWRRPV